MRNWIHNSLIAFQLGSESSTHTHTHTHTHKMRRGAAGTTGINMMPSDEQLKNRRKVGKSSMTDPEREGPGRVRISKKVSQFLKSNRIPLVFGLTGNKDQTCMNETCFVFLLYPGICRFFFCHFCALLGAWSRIAPLYPPHGHGSAPS